MEQILKHSPRPEFINRMDETIVFRALTKGRISDIVRLLLERATRRMHAQNLGVEFNDEAVDFLSEEGLDPEFGARPLRRKIQRRGRRRSPRITSWWRSWVFPRLLFCTSYR